MMNKKKYLMLFVLGVLCFAISQIFIRIPILNYLSGNLEFSMLNLKYGFIIQSIIVFTSGLFEEGFRFLFRNNLIGENKILDLGTDRSIMEPVVFGLGHGICEAVYLLAPVIGSYNFNMLLPAYSERLIAIVFHVGMTTLVFKGFEIGRKYLYTVLAIFIHSGTNYLILLRALFNLDYGVLFGIWVIVDIMLVVFIIKSKEVFRRKNEEINTVID